MKQQTLLIVGAILLWIAPAHSQFMGAEAARCGATDVIDLLKEHYEEDVLKELNSLPFFQVDGLSASITNMRETKRYEQSIKKRFCRAEVSLRLIGINDFVKSTLQNELVRLGLGLNGLNANKETIDLRIEYSVQLLEDGTNFVELDDE